VPILFYPEIVIKGGKKKGKGSKESPNLSLPERKGLRGDALNFFYYFHNPGRGGGKKGGRGGRRFLNHIHEKKK